jgi:hypothetical protein
LVSPVTTRGLAVPEAVFVPHVAVKVAAVPPLVDAVKATVICALPTVAAPMVGAPGTVIVVDFGVTDTAPEATLVPLVLVAVTVQL